MTLSQNKPEVNSCRKFAAHKKSNIKIALLNKIIMLFCSMLYCYHLKIWISLKLKNDDRIVNHLLRSRHYIS